MTVQKQCGGCGVRIHPRYQSCAKCRKRCRSCSAPVPPKHRFCAVCLTKGQIAQRRIRDGFGPRKDDLICPICGVAVQVLRAEHLRGHGFENVTTFKANFGFEILKSSSLRERARNTFKPYSAPGRSLTPGHCAAISQGKVGKPNGTLGKTRSAEFRAKMSVIAATRCLTRKGPIFAGIRGEWVASEKADGEVYTRSSWERRLLRVFDALPEVVEVESEPFFIPYFYEGRERHYIPDFLVTLTDGIRELWEVKPKEFIGDPKNQAKFTALRAYAHEHGLNTYIVTLADIQRMERRAALQTALAF